MTDKPILFSAPMVRAILDGRKTMTRRVLKPQPLVPVRVNGEWYERQGKPLRAYKAGDQLWVREAWRSDTMFDAMSLKIKPTGALICYEASDWRPTDATKLGRLRPSIHMPRWASRITLRVTAVKVERLQDISEDDAWKEGAPCDTLDPFYPVQAAPANSNSIEEGWDSARDWFKDLWDSINGAGSWEATPWVAAYTFERVN